jgi:hypothetical protein
MLIKQDAANVKHLASQHARLPAQLQIKSVKKSNTVEGWHLDALILH